jgi:hypothetical protein
MKRITLLFIAIAYVSLSAFTLTNLPKDFQLVLERAKLKFTATDGMKEVKTIPNDQVGYDYAIKYKDKDFEVRYLIMPLDSLVLEYEKSKTDTTTKVIEPNQLFHSMFLVTAMNAGMGANGGMPEVKYFDSAAVKNEFNADEGGTVFINAGKEFGQEYKYCMIVGIHKDNIGDAYIFYLSKTKDGFMDLMNPSFHSLRFK